ncbi:NAD-dependent protein deacylase, partial [Candidatus Saccharibacteria bacterium]|nr:NAD-dependent protein deacylase [Candidatus Saccharibacteria bacterium]NIU00721.1 NAD-dependent protein deacylase [Nitrosopumilaceae archaeon]NIV04496.1 NAD-dependent protein deacylase [Calditrichia bacterium]NIX61323.1 NAD-dependent protein deacylase [Nitrosopumilaceae archaeon]
ITELHGNIMRNKCIDCNAHVEEDYITKFEKKNKKAVPTCPSCGGLIRPDVVWFGELLPMDAIK